LHGDQFDTIVTVNPLLTDFACAVFYFIQKWMPHKTSRFIRRISKKFQRNSERIERRAVEYARAQGFRFVTCGHTHLPLVARHDEVLYLNSGTWTESPPCPYVAVTGDEVRLEYWPPANLGSSLDERFEAVANRAPDEPVGLAAHAGGAER
jgi:UDP-2,3-diacylglucosamine pyrophosphatase LpxH